MMHPMNTALPPLVQALLQPQCYGHAVQQVELVQTPISWVLLAGDFAYKIKRPVKLPFLDFSTLALRRHYCQEELRLNRRFATDMYLEVVGIQGTPEAPRLAGSGAPIEYAVKMRRFDAQARLDQVCARGALRPAHLSALAATLNAFHRQAAAAPASTPWGTPAQVMAPIRDNFSALQALPAPPDQPEWVLRLQGLQDWCEAQYTQLAPLLMERKTAGHVRECHGDLHLANMLLEHGQVRLFDCLEFNPDLRWTDVASDIAFAWVDLLGHGQGGLACWFLNEVLSGSGDYASARLLRLYAVYRALVRAKVAGLDHGSSDNTATQAYVALAGQISTPAPARLVITHGLSGCGKTHASSAWLQADSSANLLRLRSDVERRRRWGNDPDLYGTEATVQTYALLRLQADMLLRAGWSVLVDATFLRRDQRQAFARLAAAHGVPFTILAPQAPLAQLRERVAARQALGADASQATPEVLAQQVHSIEALQADEGPVVNQ